MAVIINFRIKICDIYPMQINFRLNDDLSRHQCNVRRDGDWAIFTCPQCEGYERRLNLRSGKTTIRPGSDPFILHEGTWAPPGLEAGPEGGYSLPN